MRSTLLLLSFHLHSLCLRIQPVCPQCFDDFASASAIRDIEAFTESYVAHAVPLGLLKKVSQKKSVQSSLSHCDRQKSLSKEFYVIVVVPLGFEIPRLSTKLYGTRCAIGIVKKDCREKPV